MAEELEQIPAHVNIRVAIDDSFSSLIDLSISLTGYTVTAFVEKTDGTTQAFTVTNTDLAAGQVTISLTAAQVTAIGEGAHKWYYKYINGSIARRAFAGQFQVIKYP